MPVGGEHPSADRHVVEDGLASTRGLGGLVPIRATGENDAMVTAERIAVAPYVVRLRQGRSVAERFPSNVHQPGIVTSEKVNASIACVGRELAVVDAHAPRQAFQRVAAARGDRDERD